jgi:sugar/nucleoside kinase (ribokinase family)
LRVVFAGKAGDDEFGSFIKRELMYRGVNMNGVIVDPSPKIGLTLRRSADGWNIIHPYQHDNRMIPGDIGLG